ncbi:hypothetical protein Taro_036172 [Colocasia esculenta]|uniref:Uncharacterized protein n=1 Tax=Colocasia esculenta TaxID=4460 RepID=A0A843WCL3_COLES|nr:hypothetical protein [Colocasia esculenta]
MKGQLDITTLMPHEILLKLEYKPMEMWLIKGEVNRRKEKESEESEEEDNREMEEMEGSEENQEEEDSGERVEREKRNWRELPLR